MTGSNQFKAIATGGSANALTPAAYAALTTLLLNGYQTGTANSTYINTTLRQSSFAVTAIAQAIADMTGAAVNDDGVIANFENQFLAMLQETPYTLSHATGTSDALVGTFTPAITSSTLIDGQCFSVRATLANATTTPTFTPNGGVITPAIIVKGNGQPLAVGDIAGAGHWCDMQWDATLARWVLLNPAHSVSGGIIGNLANNFGFSTSTTLTLAQLGSIINFFGVTGGQTLSLPKASTGTIGQGSG